MLSIFPISIIMLQLLKQTLEWSECLVQEKNVGGKDFNDPKILAAAKEKFHANKKWADDHPEYKDKTWDFNIDDNKHRDGTYYYFTRCPLNAFARKYGYL